METINWALLMFEAALTAPIVIGLRQIVREDHS